MNGPLVLTFDVGTQSARVMLVDSKGKILKKVQKQYNQPYYSKKPGWAEQKPEHYWDTMCTVCKELKAVSADLWDDIIAVTCTAIRDTSLCLDKDGKPLRDVIVWLDNRKAECKKPLPLINRILFSLVGMTQACDLQRKVSKCNWILENEPDIWEKTDKYVLLSAYINKKLVGKVIDSTASSIGHIPFSNKDGTWMKKNDLTRCIFDISEDKLCELVEPGDVLGTITKEASEETGITEGYPVIASGSDKECETLGLSCTTDEKAALSFGTTATIQFMMQKYMEPLPFLPAYVAVMKGYFNPEIQIYRGYWLVSWFKKHFAEKEMEEACKEGVHPEDILNRKMMEVPAGCDGLIMNPYFTPGVAMPVAKGALIGLSDVTTKMHIYRSIIEGINFALYEGMLNMEKRAKTKIKKLYVAGGGSQSNEICQITADMFGLPVFRIQTYEAGALGSSMVAFVSKGIFKDMNAAIDSMIHVTDEFKPDMEQHVKYKKIFEEQFVKIFGRLLPIYKKGE